jgi:hypothetical protein
MERAAHAWKVMESSDWTAVAKSLEIRPQPRKPQRSGDGVEDIEEGEANTCQDANRTDSKSYDPAGSNDDV